MSETKRRDFLKILGIGGAAGLAGCSRTAPDSLTPYVIPPEEMVRGHALWYRSACRECPAGCGLEARVREGRVHKVEGNPEHPVNGGGLCARGQAAVQGLYNPDRLRTPLVRWPNGKLGPATWDEAEKRIAEALTRARARKDAVGLLTGACAGALDDLGGEFLKAMNSARRFRYEPLAHENLRLANKLCFGAASLPVLRFADARAAFLFGAGALETYISPVGYTRGLSEARRAGGRMVYFGPRLSLTGSRADEWVPGDPGLLAMALVGHVSGLPVLKKLAAPVTPERAGASPDLIRRLAAEIRQKPFLAAAG
ncbi:MAG: molybdopterin-dependent oxidoreductase, partial [Acidobacteriia bacterium]|nr:molybdopterin-dependent oxidoreductase [Terriglobia bacterium]